MLLPSPENSCSWRGTLILHSETASRNGGDFDFDMVCLVENNRFPRFVDDRFAYEEQHSAIKNKNPKPPSPWWNLPQVAMQARGNQIGAITDLKTSCLAKGRPDLARELVDQLQNALDQLKHGTQPDQEVIRNIRNDVPTALWLKLKQKRRIEDMDEHLEVDANDKVGRLYNFTRKELGRFFGTAATAPLSDFRGVIGGQSFTPEIYQECFVVNRYYGNRVTEIMGRRQQLLAELEKANAEIEAHKQDAEARKELFFRRNQASAALHAYDKKSGRRAEGAGQRAAEVEQQQEWNPIVLLVGPARDCLPGAASGHGPQLRGWNRINRVLQLPARGRQSDRGPYRWPSGHRGNPQFVRWRSGNRRRRTDLSASSPSPKTNGQLLERLIFVAQVTKAGEVFTDRDEKGSPMILERVRPFPVKAGRSEIRNGKVDLPGNAATAATAHEELYDAA